MQQVLGRGRHVAPTCMSYNYHRVVYLDERGTDRRVWCRKLPIGPQVVPFCGLYLESYKVFPNRNYLYRGLWVEIPGTQLSPGSDDMMCFDGFRRMRRPVAQNVTSLQSSLHRP